MGDSFYITDEFVSEWNRIRDKVDGANGPGVNNTLYSLSFDPPPPPTAIAGGDDDGFWAMIGANTQDGSNKRWTYAFKEQYKNTAGYGGNSDVPNGRSDNSGANLAYNGVEDMNGSSGLYGNGVNSTNLSGSCDIQPCPAGVIVWMRPRLNQSDGSLEYWFEYPNGVDS